jgi:formiminoglutamase
MWQVVSTLDAANTPTAAIVGFCCDEGVTRNHGRVGATQAPTTIRSCLAGMAWHHHSAGFVDAGDVVCNGAQLEQAQHELSGLVKNLISAGHLPIVIGGGHEVAFGTGSGVFETDDASRRIGVINLDAHLDVRHAPVRNSGTSFRDLFQLRSFEYLCIGAARSSNTAALFEHVRSNGGAWILDEDVRRDGEATMKAVAALLYRCDDVYLSIDSDVMPASEAPGVSAPSTLGVPFETVLRIATTLAQHPKLRAADLAEVNPNFDIDNRTARLAARLIHSIIHMR